MGAIDGTNISASAPSGRTTALRDRQSDITQNVMCACNFDMRFTYVHSGWEGSANDSRVMQDALRHAEYEFPWPPRGNQKKKNLPHLVFDLVIIASDFAFPKYFVAYYRCEKLFKMGLWCSRMKFLSMIILKKGVNFCGLCGLYVIFF